MAKRRCEDHLSVYFHDLLELRRFVREVALLLTGDDFIASVVGMEGGPFDEYGVLLSKEFARRYGLEEARSWYLKVKVVGTEDGELFFLSFHRPERRMYRRGGIVAP